MRIPLPEPAKLGIDVTNVSALIATFYSILPKGTAVLTFIWAALRVYELETVQRLIKYAKERIQSLNTKDDN